MAPYKKDRVAIWALPAAGELLSNEFVWQKSRFRSRPLIAQWRVRNEARCVGRKPNHLWDCAGAAAWQIQTVVINKTKQT